MKHFILSTLFVVALFFQGNFALGQSINMNCAAPDFSCSYARPGTLHTYLADMTGVSVCYTGNSCRKKWEVTNGVIQGLSEGDGLNSVTVLWNNVNGNGTIKVTTVTTPSTAGPSCASCPTGITTMKTIPIKYLGTPGDIKINGVAYAGSYQLSCGTAPITISVDPVTNATNYAWSVPAGWGTPGTGNSFTISPSAAGAGTIKVTTSRSDNSGFTTSKSLTITRPVPTVPVITTPGPILLCSPQNITASANNATSYNWSTTGGITASGTTSTAYITGTSDGTVKVSATSSVCGVTTAYSSPLTVKRSAPTPSSITVTGNGGGSPDFMCNGSGVILNASAGEPGTSYGAWTTSDPANTYLSYTGSSAYFNSYVNSCYGIDITVSNCFGSVQKGITICVDNCFGKSAAYTVFPNPANDKINISFENGADASTLPESLTLYSDGNGEAVKVVDPANQYKDPSFKNSKTITIPVQDIPRGTYYLQLATPKGKIDKVRVLLK